MPIYEYRCRECDLRFEELVSGGREPRACPRCDGPEPVRQWSSFAARSTAGPAPPAACGTCGDPRGPGACREPS